MRPAKNIEELIKNINIDTNAKMDKAVLNDVLGALENSKKKRPAVSQPNIWRTIIKSKITKLAAAAVIIIGVLIGINYFGGSIDGASLAFAQVREAMEKVNWLRGIKEASNGVTEQWYAFESKIEIIKEHNGKITYFNYGDNRKYVYDPSSETITISYLPGDEFALGTRSPFAFLEELVKKEQDRGANLTRKTGRYNQERVEVWEILRSEEKAVEKIRIFIDIKKCLPVAAEVKYTGLNGKTISEGSVKFEYPEKGPKDIYELGVPRSAVVVDTVLPQFR